MSAPKNANWRKSMAEAAARGDKQAQRAARAARSATEQANLEHRISAIEESTERKRLLATRPDLTSNAAMRAKLASAPIEAVRWTVANFPKISSSATPPAAKRVTSPTAHASALTPNVTRSPGTGSALGAITRHSDRADELDAQMGFARPKPFIETKGTVTSCRVMTPAQARALLAEADGPIPAPLGGVSR